MPLFLTEAAGMEGDYRTARGAADAMQDHGFKTGLLFTLMRFDRWQEILATPQPAASEDEPFIVQQWQFARGMADAASGRLDDANLMLVDLAQADHSMSVADGPAREGSHGMLGLAQAVLGAKIAWAAGRHDDAIAGFQKAIAIQDDFTYAEPPEWYAPEREALGAALLQAGQAQAAEQVFRDDLARNARNPRSLFGLMKSLEAQGRVEDARYVQREFDQAWHGEAGLTLGDL
jgi:tetratricopeptide (TPR) repeat protein